MKGTKQTQRKGKQGGNTRKWQADSFNITRIYFCDSKPEYRIFLPDSDTLDLLIKKVGWLSLLQPLQIKCMLLTFSRTLPGSCALLKCGGEWWEHNIGGQKAVLVGCPVLLQRLPPGPAQHTQRRGADEGGGAAGKPLVPHHRTCLVGTAQVLCLITKSVCQA